MSRLIRYVVLLILVFATTSAFCQFGSSGSANGLIATGSVEMKVQPKFLQMTILVEGRSSDLPQAAAELKSRVELARERLKKSKVIEDSVVISKPQLQGATSPQEAQRMKMMMQQYGGGDRGRKMLDQTKSVSIQQTVTARWPLTGDDDLQRLIKAYELTESVKALDVASAEAKQPVSAAQEELAEEMTAMMEEHSYGEEKAKTGEPIFAYVAVIPTADHFNAVTEAFTKAREEIISLAQSTETQIESVKPMAATISMAGMEEYVRYGRADSTQPKKVGAAGDYEVLTNDPNEAKCTLTVTAIGLYK